MPEFIVQRIKSLTDDQIKWICAMNEIVYAADPGTEILLGGDRALSFDYWSSVLRATLLEGELWVVTVGTGNDVKTVSWASWFGPGTGLWRTEAQRALGYHDFFDKCSKEMQHWLSDTYPAYLRKLSKEIFTPEEQENNWWCSGLATHQDHQRNGFATALVDIGFQKAKATQNSGTFAALGTTNPVNVPVYRSMGFKMTGDVKIPSPKGDVDVHIFVKRP